MGAEITIRKDMEPDEIIDLFLEAIQQLGWVAEEDESETEIMYRFMEKGKDEVAYVTDVSYAMSGQFITINAQAPQFVGVGIASTSGGVNPTIITNNNGNNNP